MAVQSCITTFRAIGTTGTQTITGIADKTGTPFVPEFLMFLSASSVLNTLFYNGTGLFNTLSFERSWFRASDNKAGCQGIAEVPQFGAKIVSGLGGSGLNSAYANLEADSFLGGNPYRYGNISRVAVGEFDLTITHNLDYFPTDVMVLALAGVNTEFLATGGLLGAHATTIEPRGLLTAFAQFSATSPGDPAASAGGTGGIGWGWDSPNGGAFTTCTMTSQVCSRFQQAGRISSAIPSGAAPVVDVGGYVSTWGAASYTIASANSAAQMVIGGTNVRTASGSFTQPATTGQQTVNLGIDARWVMVSSVGTTAAQDGTLQTDFMELVTGWTDGTRQGSLWNGESANALPLLGGSYLSNASLLRFTTAGPNGASTSFTSIASFVSLTNGVLTIDWTAVDGGARKVYWFAIGEDLTGSLTVRKVVTAPPSESGTIFDFTAGGGLTPATFSLGNGDSQVFSALAPGTYSIVETAVTGWATTYSVSNGSPNDAIVVSGGEDVEVIVRNRWPVITADTPIWKLYRFDIRPRREARA